MIPFLFSIFASTLILILFRLFPRFGINTLQAIVFNYITALSFGFILFGHQWQPGALEHTQWIPFCLTCGMLFISLFLIIGKSSQLNGVAITSIAVKMSMAVSALFMLFYYHEALSFLSISGMLAAFTAVLLISVQRRGSPRNKQPWMLFVLFFGSGLLDILLNYSLQTRLDELAPSLFSAIGFGFAGLIGLFVIGWRWFRHGEPWKLKNMLAGVVLGIPNYFSIYLLLLAYRETGWTNTTVLALTNVGIVLLSALSGALLFREKLNGLKIAGLLLAISAILLLLFSQ